jgi:eukaryotic-like serine/threonine-protein kinase
MQPKQLLRDRYRIEKPLAAGGFGQTFLAIDTDLPSKPSVVVKLLKPQSNDPVTLQVAQRLFNQEAEILERLGEDNPRIPTLHAHFELNGEFYLVQEYIKGKTLTEELQQRKISESDTIAILQEIIIGLNTVHPNVIHRDLKPDNIIRRDRDRKLVLIDFGAVKQVRAVTLTTPNPSISRTIGIGTEGYMPSEQGIGYPKPASDIYAVGAIAIQCLTGSLPHLLFNEDTLSIEWQHLRHVNLDFARVLNKMIAPDYRQRYASATEALIAIESLISPPQTLPPPTPVRTPVSPAIPTIPVVRSPPPPKPIQPPVQSAVTKPSPNPATRRNFIKWLGFGGVGAVLFLALSKMGKESSNEDKTDPTPPVFDNEAPKTDAPAPVSAIAPKLTKIQFTSVKLNDKGVIIAKPAATAQIYTEALGNGVDLKMVKIPGGNFMMGSPASEKNRYASESPQHQVTVPEFYIGQTLVTQSQYQAIMGNNPTHFTGNDKFPVENVSWLDAVEFCEKLSQKTNRTYRLPSEAEWEYACRAGSNTPYAFGETINPSVVNYDGNFPYGWAAKGEYREKITPVGSFPPNLFDLYDMHGNLYEWCLDEWVDNYNGTPTDGSARGNIISREENIARLLRGGSWYDIAQNCRAAFRSHIAASNRDGDIGFRVVGVQPMSS